MPEFRVSVPGGNAGRAENPLRLPKRRLDSNGRCSRYMCVLGKSDDSRSWY